MKHDLFNWQEVDNFDGFQVAKGRVRLRASAPVAVFAEAEGYETLLPYGAEVDATFSEAVTLRVAGAKGVRVFLYIEEPSAVKASGEVFTNIDRMPDESGSVMEVKKALRAFQLEQRAALQAIRAERDALRAEALERREPEPVLGEAEPEPPAPESEAGQ